MSEAACRLSQLSNLGAIRVTGADAASFLAAQLSQAPPAAGAGQAPLAAWHDAKGRVQALFRVVLHADGYLLITHESIAHGVAASLSRYVLRADVKIEVSADFACAALIGESTAWLTQRGVDLGAEPGATAAADGIQWLRLGPALVHALAASDGAGALALDLPGSSTDEAELAEIRLGIPTLSAELQGQFLPQMLNLDVLGGVAFDKGCYPGQEIIARTQNLGTVKRRMLRFTSDTSITPPVASALLDSKGGSAGVVVRSASASDGIELLAVTRLDALADALTFAEPAGIAPRLASLPYAVPGLDT